MCAASTHTASAGTAQPHRNRPSARVVLVDDHPLIRRGVRAVLEAEPDISVCAEAETASDAIVAVDAHAPNLVIIDVSLRAADGLELVKDLRHRHPDVSLLVLSVHDEVIWSERAIRAGASGYVMKSAQPAELIAAVRQVLAGGVFLSPRVGNRILTGLMGHGRSPAAGTVASLSDRELQVFACIGEGLDLHEIAERLFISPKTAAAHRQQIKQKLSLRTSAELLRFAVQHTLSNNPSPDSSPKRE